MRTSKRSTKAPVLCDMKPWGASLMEDLHDVGAYLGC